MLPINWKNLIPPLPRIFVLVLVVVIAGAVITAGNSGIVTAGSGDTEVDCEIPLNVECTVHDPDGLDSIVVWLYDCPNCPTKIVDEHYAGCPTTRTVEWDPISPSTEMVVTDCRTAGPGGQLKPASQTTYDVRLEVTADTRRPSDGPSPRLAVDHLRGYGVAIAEPPSPSEEEDQLVLLADQFHVAGTDNRAVVREPDFFANPVSKTHNGRVTSIANPDGHLKFYRIETVPNPERIIRYQNQFQSRGWGTAYLGQASHLAVPTHKVEPGDHDPPQGLDHYKCYDVLRAQPASATVDLEDQFQVEEDIRVGAIAVFCNPTSKTDVETGEQVNIINPRAHLACYWTTRTVGTVPEVSADNQFGRERLTLNPAGLLCVPTLKHPRFEVVDSG